MDRRRTYAATRSACGEQRRMRVKRRRVDGERCSVRRETGLRCEREWLMGESTPVMEAHRPAMEALDGLVSVQRSAVFADNRDTFGRRAEVCVCLRRIGPRLCRIGARLCRIGARLRRIGARFCRIGAQLRRMASRRRRVETGRPRSSSALVPQPVNRQTAAYDRICAGPLRVESNGLIFAGASPDSSVTFLIFLSRSARARIVPSDVRPVAGGRLL